MPFKSEAQRRLLWAKHPEIAKKWAHEYPEKAKATKGTVQEKKAFSVIPLLLCKTAEETPPPGLRPSGGIGESSCQACQHFDGQGMCLKFSAQVQPNDICDAFEQIDVGTDKVIQPEQPIGPISGGPEEAGKPQDTELQDQPMDPIKDFKFACLYKCATHGLDRKQTLIQIKKARASLRLQKRSAGALDVAKGLLDTGLAVGVGGPVVAGALGGYALRKLVGPDTSSPMTARIKSQRDKELADEYSRLADEADYKRKLREAAGKTGLIRLG